MSQCNILWLVADHQMLAGRSSALSEFALQARLAAEGMRFQRAYTVLPICTPARASMLTGLYPSTHGLTENEGRFGGRPGLDSEDWLLHQPLLENNYRCAWFGKWHLHNVHSASDFGFEGFSLPGYGYPYSTQVYREYLQRKSLTEPTVSIEIPGESGLPIGSRVNLCEEPGWFEYESGTAILDGSVECHESYFLIDEAINWLHQCRKDEPFFMRVDPWGPHPPYIVDRSCVAPDMKNEVEISANFFSDLADRPAHHRKYRDYWQETLGLNILDWQLMTTRARQQVQIVETALARILTALDILDLADNTMVIFNTDHGDAVGSNGGVANKGSLMVEETMRIPLLMRGPGINPGSTCNQLVANIDIAPTILDVCGLEGPDELQGESLSRLFTNSEFEIRDGLLAQQYGLHEPDLQRAYYHENWKLVMQATGFTELYNLREDPQELSNLADILVYKDRLHQLRQLMIGSMLDISDTDRRLSVILGSTEVG